jgi:N-acetylneuraminic acid mutarotase
LFKGFTKLLICGGYRSINTCEVIDLKSLSITCKNPPNLPRTVWAAIGGVGLKEDPIICGGYQNQGFSKRCYSLKNNQWVSSVSMISDRVDAAVAQLQDGKLLVTGGYDGSDLNNPEMLAEEGWERNIPSLPVTIAHHCMVTVNSTTVMVIGGSQNGQTSGKTFYFTFGEESWTEGPQLKNKRSDHSCGKIRRDKQRQEMSIIVAGGWDKSSIFSSVEILDNGSNEWKTGLALPIAIAESQMIEDSNGGVLLVGGVISSDVNLDTLYQLPHGGQDAAWNKMENKLKIRRNRHTAFLVPDNAVDC